MLYYSDDYVTLHLGDALTVAQSLPAGSVNCIVTSPPYFGLRDYGADGQYGLEASPAEYVERMRVLFAELRRVLADDGTLWLNLGDSYRSKNMLGIPWRIAFALQDDRWILRNAIIWHKSNAMPESVTDRLSGRYEHVFLFSKRARYWFDMDPIREPHSTESIARARRARDTSYAPPGQTANKRTETTPNSRGKNPGDVWSIPTRPFPGTHFATFPPELPRRCISAGCKPGGVILDPFHGSGTTAVVAKELGRNYIGIDINSDYLDLSLTHPKRLGKSLDDD